MDPVAIAELWKLGPVVALLVAAVWYFHKRDERNDQRAEMRHRACEDRNVALARRIEALEDHLTDKYAELAERGFTGLDRVNRYLQRVLGDPQTPIEPLPALRIDHPSDNR